MANELHQRVTDLVMLESKIQEALDQRLKEVRAYAEAAEAVSRFKTMVNDQREALQARLQNIGDGEPGSTNSIAPFSMAATPPNQEGTRAASKALHVISTMFSHAGFGYACYIQWHIASMTAPVRGTPLTWLRSIDAPTPKRRKPFTG